MDIQILQLIDGARQARGLTVVIDVFRAFSVECYAVAAGAREILPVGGVDEALALRTSHPGALLGERGGRIIPGFDCGNSPSGLAQFDLRGRTVVHTTSAGTQGVANAVHADELVGGALVNARATAEYIRSRDPKLVSLVCMGLAGKEPTDEDTLCAEYLAALLRGEDPDISQRIARLAETSGRKFFDPAQQDAFPTADFGLCTQLNRFSFALSIRREADGTRVHKIELG